MALELVGTLIKVMPEVTGNGRNGQWVKQEFVIETQDTYPKKICMSVWGEKVNDLKQYTLGDNVKVSINLESREYNDRWYTEARAWKLELADSGGATMPTSQPSSSAASSAPSSTLPPMTSFSEESDDLPF